MHDDRFWRWAFVVFATAVMLLALFIQFAAPAAAQGFPNPRQQWQDAVRDGWTPRRGQQRPAPGAQGLRGGSGKTRLVIDPFSFPSAHEMYLQRRAEREYKQLERAYRKSLQPKPTPSRGMPPPLCPLGSLGNSLGTCYPGPAGYTSLHPRRD